MKWTFFPNQSAMRCELRDQTLDELIETLKTAKESQIKSECPWIKLAVFGGHRTAKNSLRHDRNVVAITGVEGDYDGGQVSIEQAQSLLEKAGIKAILYSSPSYTAQSPRWRVLAPLSKDHAPHLRSALLGRVNGALGGILSHESFTLSQSYYFGPVSGVQYIVTCTFDDLEDGHFVDELDELDDIAVYKKPLAHKNDESDQSDYSLNIFEMATRHFGRKLKTGDNRRALLKVYIASRSGKGLVRDEVRMLVQHAIDTYFDPSDPIDDDNILQVINHFADRDQADQPVDLSLIMKTLGQSQAPVLPNPKPITPDKGFPAPFKGAMADIVQCSLDSAFKEQPELATLAALVAMAASINGEYSTGSGGRFNLYGIGALQSGGGKDNPRMIAETVVGYSGGTVLGKPASGAALEDYLSPRQNQLASIDEMAFLLKAVNDARAPAHLQDLVAVLLKLYSASRGVYNKRIRAKAQAHSIVENTAVPNPCVSLLGFSTLEGFASAFSESNLTDGLFGRMLFVIGRDDVRPKRPSQGVKIPASCIAVLDAMTSINKLAQAGVGASVGSIIVGETPSAHQMLDDLLVNCEHSRDRSHKVAPSLYARSFEKIERICGVLAVWDDPTSPMITPAHVQWATQAVYASDEAILAFVRSNLHANEINERAARLRTLIAKVLKGEFKYQKNMEREAVEEGKCVARSQLLRVSKMSSKEFGDTLMHMQDLGEVVAYDEKGKKLKFITEICIQDE
ncbi:MAG TPA: hypothetical protein VFV43_09230 [Limnobacter sp.]|nr:hypothetical protein [Limnobacter sp.]